MKRLRDAFFLFLGIAIIAWSFYIFWNKPAPANYQPEISKPYVDTLEIGGKTIIIELADTPAERERGLSGKESLPEGHGLLFIFDKPDLYGFWMKEMNFPIDVVWLDESMVVVDIEKNVTPDSFPHIFYPPRPVKYVLETNVGELY